jgi:uncharacterized RDD family membrane protein YckC
MRVPGITEDESNYMTNSSDTLQIDTPENVTFDYDVAGIGSRFLSALVDTLLILLLQVIVFGTLILLAGMDGLFSSDAPTWMIAVLSLVAFVFFWGYYIFFEILWNGQTPGKRMVGLRVIRVDGMPVTAVEVVIRNLVRLIDLLPTAYGVGVITMFVNEKSRRLGDLAAGTVVVHDRSVTTLSELGRKSNPLETLQSHVPVPGGFPLERLNDRDIEILEGYLQRRYQLPNREELALQILNSLYTRVGLSTMPARTDLADEVLAAIYKAVKVRKLE